MACPRLPPAAPVRPGEPQQMLVPQAPGGVGEDGCVKKIGFLSFGHWGPSPRVAGEHGLGRAAAVGRAGRGGRGGRRRRRLLPGAPLRPAARRRRSRCWRRSAARTRDRDRHGVIDMRYENPLYMAEDAGAADLIAGGRLQLGISRGSPEQVVDGWRYFGYQPAEGESDADMARRHTRCSWTCCEGGVRRAEPAADVRQPAGAAARRAPLARSARADLVGCRIRQRPRRGRPRRHEPDELDARRGRRERRAVPRRAGTADPRLPRGVEGGRARARAARLGQPQHLRARRRPGPQVLRGGRGDGDQVGYIDASTRAIFGRTYAAEPDVLVGQLADDEAIAAADTLLLTVPNQLGVDYNAHVIESVLTHVAPALGWR